MMLDSQPQLKGIFYLSSGEVLNGTSECSVCINSFVILNKSQQEISGFEWFAFRV